MTHEYGPDICHTVRTKEGCVGDINEDGVADLVNRHDAVGLHIRNTCLEVAVRDGE